MAGIYLNFCEQTDLADLFVDGLWGQNKSVVETQRGSGKEAEAEAEAEQGLVLVLAAVGAGQEREAGGRTGAGSRAGSNVCSRSWERLWKKNSLASCGVFSGDFAGIDEMLRVSA